MRGMGRRKKFQAPGVIDFKQQLRGLYSEIIKAAE